MSGIRLTVLLLVSACCVRSKEKDEWNLVWTENFEELNPLIWEVEENCYGGGNQELQCYTKRKENLNVTDGYLIIKAIPENYLNKNFTSGRIKQISNGFLYGRFEARCKLPKGKHLWPAFLMLPQKWAYGGWAASGEIDIFEFRGQQVDTIEGSLRFGGVWPQNQNEGSGPTSFEIDLSENFHIYSIEWDPNEIRWYFDGKLFFDLSLERKFWSKIGKDPYRDNKRSPFDKKFIFLLNLAVGGNYFPKDIYGNFSVEDAQNWPNPEYIVDWIKVWQRRDYQQFDNVNNQTCCNAIRLNKVCFDPQINHCVEDDKNQTVFCKVNEEACDGVCYDSAIYTCNHQIVQPK